jgi:gliding motility-associated-like protein
VFEKVGNYPVAMIATNSWGCADTIVKSILVEENFSLFVPNAFSPNADGKNDIFMPKGVGILSYHLEVFDRWGQSVFKSVGYQQAWDGTYKGRYLPTAAYYYVIELNSLEVTIPPILGTISIVH